MQNPRAFVLFIVVFSLPVSPRNHLSAQAVGPDGSFSYSVPIEIPPGTAGMQPLLSDSSIAGIHYFHPNHVGSIRMITDKDGNKLADYLYTPYGELFTGASSGTEISKYKYTAQQEDTSTGLYYYKARFYDPAIGSFMSADKIIPNFENPQSYNRYAYVEGNPVEQADTTGHWPGKKWLNNAISDITNTIENAYNDTVKKAYDSV